MCCVISSCYLTFPDCFGCESAGSLLCLESECLTCKCVSKDPKICCIFNRTDCVCVKPTTCVSGMFQFFFLDSRCAFPCNDKVPCICSVLPFCVACVRWKFKVMWFAKMEDIVKAWLSLQWSTLSQKTRSHIGEWVRWKKGNKHKWVSIGSPKYFLGGVFSF